MNKGGTQDVIGGVTATMTHAIHSCGIQDGDDIIYGGEAAGYVLHFGDGRSLYFAGDTAVFSDMQLIEQLYHPNWRFFRSAIFSRWARAKPRWHAGYSRPRKWCRCISGPSRL